MRKACVADCEFEDGVEVVFDAIASLLAVLLRSAAELLATTLIWAIVVLVVDLLAAGAEDNGPGMTPVRLLLSLTDADAALERSIARDRDLTDDLGSSLSERGKNKHQLMGYSNRRACSKIQPTTQVSSQLQDKQKKMGERKTYNQVT